METWLRPDVPIIPGGEGERPHLFDTHRQDVVPVGPQRGMAGLYVCGITPYDATHMGHANTYVAFDLLHRAWLDAGLTVSYAQNVTDVDDPLLERADATGTDWRSLATEQIAIFRSDMEALRVIPPQNLVGVVEAIPLIVRLIEHLQKSDAIYSLADADYPDLYFRSTALGDFGHISHLSPDEQHRVFAERGGDPDRPGKRDPLDALVWRRERPGEPAWDTALGRGRPGWHNECTAIALNCLGAAFDVQGGGSDLAFPHHEMCAAQAQAATGKPLARAYVHAGMVGLDGEKMSKSRGNLVFVRDLRASGQDPMAIRLALLSHHYRSDWEWTAAGLQRAGERLSLWRRAARLPGGSPAGAAVAAMRAALRDDLDAPLALRAVDAWAAATLASSANDSEAPRQMAHAVDALLGIDLLGGKPAR